MANGKDQPELIKVSADIVRAETESMVDVAHRFPRDWPHVIQRIEQELRANRADTEEMWYSIPFTDRSGDKEEKVYVEGLSIKAALLAAREMGNCIVAARVWDESEEAVDLIGVFYDLETNHKVLRPQRVSKWGRKRSTGQYFKLNPDVLTRAVQAGASKAIRNSVLDGLPPSARNRMYDTVKSLIAETVNAGQKGKAQPSQDDKARAWVNAFGNMGITPEQLGDLLGKPWKAWGTEEFVKLKGLQNALRSGETTLASVFGTSAPAPGEDPGPVEEVDFGVEEGSASTTPAPLQADPPQAAPSPEVQRAETYPTVAAPAPAPVDPKRSPEREVLTGEESDALVGKLLDSIKGLTTKEAYQAWPDQHRQELAGLPWDAMKAVVSSYEEHGKTKGLARVRSRR